MVERHFRIVKELDQYWDSRRNGADLIKRDKRQRERELEESNKIKENILRRFWDSATATQSQKITEQEPEPDDASSLKSLSTSSRNTVLSRKEIDIQVQLRDARIKDKEEIKRLRQRIKILEAEKGKQTKSKDTEAKDSAIKELLQSSIHAKP